MCETWVKHRRQECSTNICDYNYKFLPHFIIKGDNTTPTKNVRVTVFIAHLPSMSYQQNTRYLVYIFKTIFKSLKAYHSEK